MRVIPPLTITDAILTSSSAPETAPAVYVGGTTYALNALVYTGTRGGVLTVWKSKAGANAGNTPASSPTWWLNTGTTYSVYDGSAWALGDICIVVATNSHHSYECIQAGTGHTPASSPTWWLDLSAPLNSDQSTNRWAMFDKLRNTQTEFVSPGIWVLTPGCRVNSLFLGGLVATSFSVVVTSVIGGGVVYTATVTLPTRQVFGWYDYFFEPFSNKKSAVLFDLPPFSDAIITVSLTNTQGNAKCGACVIGNFVFIGNAQYQFNSSNLNFSSVTRDAFGNATMKALRNVPQTVQTVSVEKSRLDKIIAVREALNGTTAVWTALDADDSGYFESFVINGFARKFEIVGDTPNNALINLELEEL